MGKREEQFPLSNELIENFIQVNKKQWSGIKHTEQYIFVNFSMVRMQAAWIVPKLLYAKGIEEATGAKVVVLTWKSNEVLTKFIESFRMKHIALDRINQNNIPALLKAAGKTTWFMLTDGSGEGLKKMRVCGISAGRSIYEDILRTSDLSTIKSARNKICFKKILHLLWTAYSLDNFCKRYSPLYMLCDDFAYHENMIIKLFHKYHASIYSSNNEEEWQVKIDSAGELMTHSAQRQASFKKRLQAVGQEGITWSEQYLEERYAGKNGRTIDRGAFADKKVLLRENAEKELGLDSIKKNIVIMAHTFSDAVFNYGTLYFRDYYDWVEQTLILAAANDRVNWILKPHPTRGAYNESKDSIEKMYQKYKRPNIYFLSDEFSAESIKNIADAIVTIGSNAGAEFSCEGIPAVIVGKPYYHGFGYTIEPENFSAYKDCLENIQNIEKLTKEQCDTAKKVFYLRSHGFTAEDGNMYRDEFADLINHNYNKMLSEIPLQYFAGNDGTQKYNDIVMKEITDYFKTHDMKECEYYKRGVMRGKKYEK